ncbi:MAG: bL21 family ribosomal protein, partial [Spirochaetales bacterium]|nr:bL21 family ribosomal protein [Spirochaetales bacterium]
VYKYHRRKGYRRTQGHRQQYSILTIDKINA